MVLPPYAIDRALAVSEVKKMEKWVLSLPLRQPTTNSSSIRNQYQI